MSVLSTCLPDLRECGASLETFGRTGDRERHIDGRTFVELIRVHRARLAPWPAAGRRLIGLNFRSEETVEFLVAALAAMAEGYTVVPLYPNWSEETQLLYLRRYGVRHLAAGSGFIDRARRWAGDLDQTLHVRADPEALRDADPSELPAEIFPSHLPPDHACAWIFTSGTSGDLAKCTEITMGNLEAAIENIRRLDFLREGMAVHSPLSTSHIFAFVVIMGFLALKPRRILFSDVQYLSRLSEEKTGKVDALILVPIVLNRMRTGLYDRLTSRLDGRSVPAELRRLARIPLPVRKALKRLTLMAEDSVIHMEQGRRRGALGLPAVYVARSLLGPSLRRRLGSPDFVVVGGAKPCLHSMALLEVMGVRCLQGWGMTETTGPLAVCNLRDRFSGAFGTCGDLFPHHRTAIEGDGELVVEGPQIAHGYVEPDGNLVPFNGRKKTGDTAIFDPRGRLQVLGKTSDRITTDNGLNYNPVPLEEDLKALDLDRENLLDEVVVIGDGRPRLGVVFFLRDEVKRDERAVSYIEGLVRAYNQRRPVDEKVGPWTVSERSLRDVGALGPSGKVVRRRVEEEFGHIYGGVLV